MKNCLEVLSAGFGANPGPQNGLALVPYAIFSVACLVSLLCTYYEDVHSHTKLQRNRRSSFVDKPTFAICHQLFLAILNPQHNLRDKQSMQLDNTSQQHCIGFLLHCITTAITKTSQQSYRSMFGKPVPSCYPNNSNNPFPE